MWDTQLGLRAPGAVAAAAAAAAAMHPAHLWVDPTLVLPAKAAPLGIPRWGSRSAHGGG